MGLGPIEAIIVLAFLLLAFAIGLARLPRLIRQLTQIGQRQSSSEPQTHPQNQVEGYKPLGWMDEERREKDRV